MSYDLDLFTAQANLDPINIIQQAAMMPDSARTSSNQATMRHLERDNPNFHIKVTDDAIKVLDEVEGIRITLYAHGAQVSIPFWYTDSAIIEVAFQTAQHYIRIILSHTGYAVYDPQLGRIVDIERDLPEMIAAYKQALRGMQSFLG